MHGMRSGLVELGGDRDDPRDGGQIRPLEGTRLIPAGNEQFESSAVCAEGGRRVSTAHAEGRCDPTDGRVLDWKVPGGAGDVGALVVGEELGPLEGRAGGHVDAAVELSKE